MPLGKAMLKTVFPIIVALPVVVLFFGSSNDALSMLATCMYPIRFLTTVKVMETLGHDASLGWSSGSTRYVRAAIRTAMRASVLGGKLSSSKHCTFTVSGESTEPSSSWCKGSWCPCSVIFFSGKSNTIYVALRKGSLHNTWCGNPGSSTKTVHALTFGPVGTFRSTYPH